MRECPECRNAIDDTARFCTYCGAASTSTSDDVDPLIGHVVNGKFRVEELVGQGGMGRVYRAKHLTLDRPVVLKILHKEFSTDPQVVQRFQREARAASRLNHPNSIAVLDFGASEDGTLFMAMEFLGGRDLAKIISEEFPVGEPRIVRIGAQILSALAEAHAQGIVHRDLKPENVMVEPRRGEPDFVKVLDFGIAKITAAGANEPKLTLAGLVCGTPEYMSPEQARGAEIDARADLYSMGVILYQLATGALPFQSDTPVGFLTKHLSEAPVPARQRRGDVSKALEAVISKAMEKDPAKRFQTADEMRDVLISVEPANASAPAGQATSGTAGPVAGPAASSRSAVPPESARHGGRPQRSRFLLWAMAAAVIALALGGVALFGRQHVGRLTGSPGNATPTTATAPPSSPPTPPTVPTSPPTLPTAATPTATPTATLTHTQAPPPPSSAPTIEASTGARERSRAEAPERNRKIPAVAPKATSAAKITSTSAVTRSAAAVRRDPVKALAFYRKAEARRAEQDVDGAIKLYLVAESSDPELAEVQKRLGLCYQLKGDRRRAAYRYRRYLETHPPDAERVRAILSTLE